MKFFKVMVSLVLMLVLHPVVAKYNVDNNDSEVTFSGEHAGMTFSGEFKKWRAQITLPGVSANNEGAISATFDLSTAKTGDSTYDETLPEGDWFDVENHPQGFFESTSVAPSSDGYIVEGNLTLRGKAKPVVFTLKEHDGRLVATFAIDRLAYGIGTESDPDADWIDQQIKMTVDIPKR